MAAESDAAPPRNQEKRERETRIHVGNLTFNADEEYLQNVFGEYGGIAAVKVIRERGRSKGYGFIDFVDSASADDAIKARDRTQLDGRTITVAFARPRDAPPEPKANVHVGKLPPQCDDRSLREFFCNKLSQPDTLEEARVVTSRSQNNESAGYGFVRFRSTDDAARAIEELTGAEFDGVLIEVAYARRTGERQPLRSINRRNDRPNNNMSGGGNNRSSNRRTGGGNNDNYYGGNNNNNSGGGGDYNNVPRSSPPRRGGYGGRRGGGGGGGGSGGNSYRDRDGSAPLEEGSEQFIGRRVFVGGLSEETDEQCLRLNFSAYGELENCEIVRDKRTLRSRSYAFVTYRTEQQAHEAVDGLNGVEIDDKEIQVEMARSRGKRLVSSSYSSSSARGPRHNNNNSGGANNNNNSDQNNGGGGGGGGYSNNYNGGGNGGGGGGSSYNNSYNGGGNSGGGGGGRRYTSGGGGSGGGNYPRSNNTRSRQQQQQPPSQHQPQQQRDDVGGNNTTATPAATTQS